MSEGAFAGRPWPQTRYGARKQGALRRYAGIGFVVVLHLVLVWALINGLATRVAQVVEKPVETRIIEPVKPPPPPPVKTVQLPPPKIKAPPPPFVPPPEVHVAPPPEPTITHQAVPVPTQVAPPPAPPAPAPVEAPAKPVSREAGVVCPNSDKVRSAMVYPQEAQDNDITGDVLISFVVDPEGHVTDEKVEKSADPVLDRAAFNTVKKFNCIAQGQSVRVQVPFSFNLN